MSELGNQGYDRGQATTEEHRALIDRGMLLVAVLIVPENTVPISYFQSKISVMVG